MKPQQTLTLHKDFKEFPYSETSIKSFYPFSRWIVLVIFLQVITYFPGKLHAQELDRPPSDSEVNYAPDDGRVSAVNPAAFIWLPVQGVKSYVMQYSSSESFNPENTITVRDLDITVHIPTEVVKPGTWYWRYGYRDGNRDIFSRTRRFEIPETATVFPFIPVNELIARIPKARPRIHFSPEMVAEIRSDTKGRYAHLTEGVIRSAEEILKMKEPLFDEPRPWMESDNPRMAYVNSWRSMRPYTQRMVTCALAYLYTGEKRFAEEARRRLMPFMEWDIDGPSTSVGNDELGMDIAENAPPVFDWIYPVLSEKERQKCLEVLAARIHQISYKVHRARPMETRPFASHQGRMIGFVAEASIVLAHDVPEVSDWLDYTLKLLWSMYPAWGYTDGGWQEGVSYWNSYMSRMFRVVAELDRFGIPLRDKPFFKNTGYFGLYAAYPKRPTRAFGDDPYGSIGVEHGKLMYEISTLYMNPYFRWHAGVSGVNHPTGRTAFLYDYPSLKPQTPVNLPQSHAFKDVGLVAIHSNMSEPENNVLMLFQSNPFGAISHNHACQNAFIIEAYGEPMAITSGARQLHGSPHHQEWMWNTKAHNSILVDNEGQVARQRSSRGKIIHYEDNGAYVYTVGDATEAYANRLEKFHRHMLFIRPNYFVIIDDLKTSGKASTFQWLLHSPVEIRVDSKNHIMVNRSGNVRLTSRFLTPVDIDYKQHSGFTPQVEVPAQMRNQFHLTASTYQPAASKLFVTVMCVDRTAGSPVSPPEPPSTARQELTIKSIEDQASLDNILLKAELLEAEGGIALKLGDDLILWRDMDSWLVKSTGAVSTKRLDIRKGYFMSR